MSLSNMKHTKQIILLFILSLVIVGCGAMTAQGLRDNPSGEHTFRVARNYQSAYRIALQKARRENSGGMDVDGNLYTDIHMGTITITSPVNPMVGSLGIYMVIDINKITEGRSRITAYSKSFNWRKYPKKVEKWFDPNEVLGLYVK